MKIHRCRASLVAIVILALAAFEARAAAAAAAPSTSVASDQPQDWKDTFYQYRIPLSVKADAAGWHTLPLGGGDITSAINVWEELKFDPTWFAHNHVTVVDLDDAAKAAGERVEAGFHLVVDDKDVLPPDVMKRQGIVSVPVEPGATYFLKYRAAGGRTPALEFEPVFPVGHVLRPNAYLISQEPRILPLAETEHEVLMVPNTAKMPLHVKDQFVTGLKSMSLRKARVAFLIKFDKPGKKRLMLYYQPTTGHFLTIPKLRAAQLPPTAARLTQVAPAEKYLGSTRYRLPETAQFAPWVAATTVKLTPSTPPPTARGDAIRISSAANEAQSFQLVLQPKAPFAFKGVRSSYLVNGDHRIGSENVSAARIEYVPISRGSYLTPTAYIGPIADPLTKLVPQDISPVHGNVALWFTVRTPAGTPAGTYGGTISIDVADGASVDLPIQLEVFGFDLPEFSPFRSSMGGAHLTKSIGKDKTIADYHHVSSKEDVTRLARAYFTVMAQNKFTPHNVMQYTDIGMNWTPPPKGFNVDAPDNDIALHDWDFTQLNKDLAYYIDELKVNAFTLVHTNPSVINMLGHLPGKPLDTVNRHPPHSTLNWQNWREMTAVGYDKRSGDEYTEVTKKQFEHVALDFYRSIAKNLNEHGWLDRAFILVDETLERGYDPILDFMRLLKSDPLTSRIQFAWCLQSPGAFNHKIGDKYAFHDLLDIYVPETNENNHFWEKHYFNDYGIKFDDRAKLWNYATYSARCAIDAPGINNRMIAMEVFNNGGGGFLLWGTFVWDSKEHQESNHDNPWEQPYTRWGNGAMSYFYPPRKDGPASEPDFTIIPSLRVMTYREGVDDYEYAWLLEGLINKARAAGRDVSRQGAVLKDIERFFGSTVQWSQNDAWYLDLRERMARAIVELKTGAATVSASP